MLDGIGKDAAPIVAAIKAGRAWGGLKASMGAGYGDGSVSAWTSAEWVALTAVAQPVVVTVLGSKAPNVNAWDAEAGDLTDPQAAADIVTAANAGEYPVIYTNRSNKAAVISAAASHGLVRGHGVLGNVGRYGLWVATLDGSFTDLDGSDLRTQPGVVAVQHLGAGTNVAGQGVTRSGGPFDVSLVVDALWLPVKVPPPVVPTWQATALKDAQALVALLAAHQ
jgi:hypothetical protein